VKPDSSVQKRPIVTGLSLRGMTVIESGVALGETVVTDGQLRLAEGSKVTISPQPSAQQTSAKEETTKTP